jgi:hypothetical protein
MKARESTPQIRAAYRARFALRNALVGGWLLYAIAILWTGLVPFNRLPWFLFGGVIVFGITSMIIWRCPACGAQFGRSWSEARRPACKVALIDDSDRAV